MDSMMASIQLFAGNFAPRGWAFCDGQLLSIAQNTALFSLLGTTYGGDGRTTFGLPDLRGRGPIGPRNGPGLSDYRLGENGGLEQVTLNITEIPSHNHLATGTVKASTADGTTNNPDGGNFSTATTQVDRSTTHASNVYGSGVANTNMASENVGVVVANNGGGRSHENRQPYLAINYIIATVGIFPSRS